MPLTLQHVQPFGEASLTRYPGNIRHILKCDTSYRVSGDKDDFKPFAPKALPSSVANSLCATVVNALFDTINAGVTQSEAIDTRLMEAYTNWFRDCVTLTDGVPVLTEGDEARVDIGKFPDEWREGYLSLFTGYGSHYYRQLVHPSRALQEGSAHELDTRHRCRYVLGSRWGVDLKATKDDQAITVAFKGFIQVRPCQYRRAHWEPEYERLIPDGMYEKWVNTVRDTSEYRELVSELEATVRSRAALHDQVTSIHHRQVRRTCDELLARLSRIMWDKGITCTGFTDYSYAIDRRESEELTLFSVRLPLGDDEIHRGLRSLGLAGQIANCPEDLLAQPADEDSCPES
jgi:hypothetical protein